MIDDAEYRTTVRELYAARSNDDIEVDDRARVSRGQLGAGGAFVQAWVWVRDSDCDHGADE